MIQSFVDYTRYDSLLNLFIFIALYIVRSLLGSKTVYSPTT
jgi:hypothetical protein